MNLIIIKTPSIGDAYQIANELSSQGLEILELSPLGKSAHLILKKNADIKISKNIFKKYNRTKFVEILNLSQVVFDTYLSVSNHSLDQGLLLIESSFVGDLFAIANTAVQSSLNLKLVDLRLLRGVQAVSYLMITSVNIDSLKTFTKKIKLSHIKKTLITNPSEKIREYF